MWGSRPVAKPLRTACPRVLWIYKCNDCRSGGEEEWQAYCLFVCAKRQDINPKIFSFQLNWLAWVPCYPSGLETADCLLVHGTLSQLNKAWGAWQLRKFSGTNKQATISNLCICVRLGRRRETQIISSYIIHHCPQTANKQVYFTIRASVILKLNTRLSQLSPSSTKFAHSAIV